MVKTRVSEAVVRVTGSGRKDEKNQKNMKPKTSGGRRMRKTAISEGQNLLGSNSNVGW